jgi:hypothetical protein
MKRILIAKDVAYGLDIVAGTVANIGEVNRLENGAIAIFSEAGVLIPIAALASTLNDVKKVIFAVGTGSATTGARISQPIQRENATVTKTAYAAAVQQITWIGNDGALGSLNPPASVAAGDEMTVKIYKMNKGRIPAEKQESFTYRLTASDTFATGITALIALMQTSEIVTTVVEGAQVGIKMTATDVGTIFTVAYSGILEDATIIKDGYSNSINPSTGHGTQAHIAALETANDVEEGNTNMIHFASRYFSRATRTAASNYITYNIQYEQEKDTATSRQLAGVWDLTIAIPTGSGIIANWDLAMAAIFGIGTNTANQVVETGT